MLHPAIQAVERYYTAFNQKDWSAIAAMFDLPTALIVGSQKSLVESMKPSRRCIEGSASGWPRKGQSACHGIAVASHFSRCTTILPS